MDENADTSESAPSEPVQGHFFDIVTIRGVGPMYRPNLGFRDTLIEHGIAAPTPPAKP